MAHCKKQGMGIGVVHPDDKGTVQELRHGLGLAEEMKSGAEQGSPARQDVQQSWLKHLAPGCSGLVRAYAGQAS